jgi:NAD(P)-dependent dehydrogenase (short-subunit alcohol dehydrogenase family)
MPTALVIGASRGIGQEFVRQLLAGGWKVFATARDDNALSQLRAQGAEPIKLDVNIPESLAGLGWNLDGVKLDLAIYVSGVYGPRPNTRYAPTVQEFDQVMHTNVLGAMQVIPLVAPMVEAAGGKFVFISSALGSIAGVQSGDGWLYRASKAALNMAVKSASFDYPKATMIAMSPGWVRTDMGGENAALSVEESVGSMLKSIAALTPQDTGGFRNQTGQTAAW